MAPRLNHPFLEGLKDIPEGKKKDLQKIKSWMNTQSHLPQISDEYVYLFLHACYYSHEKTKSAIDSYFTIRANHPSIFADRNAYSPRMQTVLELGDAYQGGFISRMFVRNSSSFNMHPEILKQIMKERDGQTLCNYYDSDMYKMKAADVVEQQSRVLNEGTPKNVKEDVVTYEHMLNCAQPRQKPKVIVEEELEEEEEDEVKREQTRRKAMADMWRNRRKLEEGDLSDDDEQILEKQNQKNKKGNGNAHTNKKIYRKRTTIMPLYLKKIQSKAAVKKNFVNSDSSDKTKYETELLNTKKGIPITKSEYRYGTEEKVHTVQKLLKEKVQHADYENETICRIKPNLKYTEGSEEERHWYQNSNTPSKFDAGCREIKDFNPGK